MEVVKQLQVELGEAMKKRDLLKEQLLSVVSCIGVYKRELELRQK